MKKEISIGRQPILDKGNNIFAYELLYRDLEQDHLITDNRSATATVLVNILNQFGIKKIIGTHPAFIKIDSSFLLHDMILSIPKEHFIFAIFDDAVLGSAVIERIRQLHSDGYRFAINDTAFTAEILQAFKPVIPHLSFIKIDSSTAEVDEITPLIKKYNLQTIQFIATKLETRSAFGMWSRDNIDLFQGYYFSKPKLLTHTIFSTDQITVLKVWRLIIEDVPVNQITVALEESPTLVVQLLRYVNSAYFHFRAPIKSVTQVISLIGRMPLIQWLLLLINAKNMGKEPEDNPLQGLLLNRIEIMIGLHGLMDPKPNITKDELYFVGLLSLIDILLEMPLSSVLEELHIDPAISAALLKQEGILGEILMTARAIEYCDTAAIEKFLNFYRIAPDDVVILMLNTIEKINKFESSI